MRKIRILSILFFIASAAVFGAYLLIARQVLDTQGPRIIMDSDTVEISVEDDISAILAGVTAMDQAEGDVTELLLVEQLSNFIDAGRREATIAAFDKAGNVTKTVRTVVYKDYVEPYYVLERPLIFPAGISSITAYMKAQDSLDGELTSRIKFSSEEGIYTSVVGLYDVIFTVSNTAGDTVKLPVTVEIYDSAERSRQPVIVLSEYLVYVSKGTSLDPTDYIREIYYGNNSYIRKADGLLHYDGYVPQDMEETISLRNVAIDNPIDTAVPGVYEVNYSYRWSENAEPGSTRLIVVVTE